MNKIKSEKKIEPSNWPVIITIISVVAAIVSAFSACGSYMATSNYYSLASRPYVKVENIYKDKWSSKLAFDFTCLQSPIKIVEGLLICEVVLGNKRYVNKHNFLETDCEMVVFPGEKKKILTHYEYPSTNKCILDISIKYKTLSNTGDYFYDIENVYLIRGEDKRWFQRRVTAN